MFGSRMLVAALAVMVSVVPAYPLDVFEYVRLYRDVFFEGKTLDQTVWNGCNNVPDWWKDRISSIDTHGDCVVLYDDWNCRGSKLMVLPGSPNQNDFTALDFNDVTKSVHQCELDLPNFSDGIFSVDPMQRKLSGRNGTEYKFFDFLFGILSPAMRTTFEKRAVDYGYINWDFYFSAGTAPASISEQYRRVILEVAATIRSLAGGPSQGFNVDNMEALSNLADAVVLTRQAEAQRYPADYNSEAYVWHKYTIIVWQELLDAVTQVLQIWKGRGYV